MATIKLVKDDSYPPLEFSVIKDGAPVDLTGATIVFFMKNSSTGTVKVNGGSCTTTDAANGKCRYTWGATDLDTAGDYVGEIQVTDSAGKIQTSYSQFNLIIRADL